MATLQYTPKQYLNKVKMSSRFTLLVEGRDDKRFFKMLIAASMVSQPKNIVIDSAEIIASDGEVLGNREKVEKVSAEINSKSYKHKYLGFVDREYRKFQLADPLIDEIGEHFLNGRLVWSRGHSLENYFFDFSVFYEPFRDFALNEYFDEALEKLKFNFENLMRLGCALTLAGKEEDLTSLVQNSIDWQHLTFDSSSILELDLSNWKTALVRKHHLDNIRAEKLAVGYLKWHNIVQNSDFEVVRWLCHGHIGLRLLWAGYAKQIYEVCLTRGISNPHKEAGNVLRADERVRFNACASSWLRRPIINPDASPHFCIEMLI